MPVRKSTIIHTAAMAKLKFTPADLDDHTDNLGKASAYFNRLNRLKAMLSNSQAGLNGVINVWRKDEVKPSLTRAETLVNAPEKEEDFFKVPRIIG